MRFRTLAYLTIPTLVLVAAGCGGGGGGTTNPTDIAAVSPTGKITPFTTIAAMKPGAKFYLILDRPGGKKTATVTLNGTNSDANGRIIIFTSVSQPVGSGDAGALIVDSKGNSVGAFSTILEYGSLSFQATAIEDEQSVLLAGPVSKKGSASFASPINDGTMRVVRGVSPYLWSIISKDTHNPLSKLFKLDNSVNPNATSKSTDAHELSQNTPYSSTIFMVSSYGDAVSAYTYGCVTTPYLGKLLCLGHSLNWEGGSQDIPCFYGTVTNFLTNSSNGNSKVAFPNMAQSAGTLVDDRRFGVVVDPTVTATPIPVVGTVTLNTNAPVTFTGEVSQDLDLETGFVLTNIGQGVSNIVDASEIAGTATGSATINFPDGTSSTIDLTDPGSQYLISDLYFNFEEALIDPNTGEYLPVSSINFTFAITTGAGPAHKPNLSGRKVVSH